MRCCCRSISTQLLDAHVPGMYMDEFLHTEAVRVL